VDYQRRMEHQSLRWLWKRGICGWRGGYGFMVEVKHAGGLFIHLRAFIRIAAG
jgi:hypothetical protein